MWVSIHTQGAPTFWSMLRVHCSAVNKLLRHQIRDVASQVRAVCPRTEKPWDHSSNSESPRPDEAYSLVLQYFVKLLVCPVTNKLYPRKRFLASHNKAQDTQSFIPMQIFSSTPRSKKPNLLHMFSFRRRAEMMLIQREALVGQSRMTKLPEVHVSE